MAKQVEFTWHDIIKTPLPNGQFQSSLGQEHHAVFTCDLEHQRIYCDGKYIPFRYECGSEFAYQIRKTFIRSCHTLEDFWKEFSEDKWWYSFRHNIMEHIGKYGKTA